MNILKTSALYAIILLKEHRDKLDAIAQTLLQKEKINEQEFNDIFDK